MPRTRKPPRKRSPPEYMAALHEAGHAVVSIALGWLPEQASIVPDDVTGYDGEYETKPRKLRLARRCDRDLVIARMMAGLEAERRRTRRAVMDVAALGGAGGDYNAAVALVARHLTPSQREDLWYLEVELEAGRQRARDILRDHWPATEAVAEALLLFKRLKGDAIVRVVREVDPALARRSTRSSKAKS